MSNFVFLLVATILLISCGRQGSPRIQQPLPQSAPVQSGGFDFGEDLDLDTLDNKQGTVTTDVVENVPNRDNEEYLQHLRQLLQMIPAETPTPMLPPQPSQAELLFQFLARLDGAFGLYIKKNDLWRNWSENYNEIWFKTNRSKEEWTYMLPDGSFYLWTNRSKNLEGRLLAKLPPTIYAAPQLLANAFDHYCLVRRCF